MAWTTPRTWVVSEIVSASVMNTHIRDNLNVLSGHRHDNADAGDGDRLRYVRWMMMMGA